MIWKKLQGIVGVLSGLARIGITSKPAGTYSLWLSFAGSGKTSLLNALAGRLQRVGALDGEILVNGKPRENTFKRISAYVSTATQLALSHVVS